MSKIYLTLIFIAQVMASDNLLILEEIQKSIIQNFKLEGTVKVIETIPIEMVKGDQEVEAQKNQARLALQKRDGLDATTPLTGKEKIKQLMEKNRKKVKELKALKGKEDGGKSADWIEQKKQEMNRWKNTREDNIAKWQAERLATIDKWIAERQKFLKRVPEYKENLAPIPAPPTPPKIVKKEVTVPPLSEYHLIDQAFAGEAKDQGKRPTCAAFAGIRAVEIMMARKQQYRPLSEQYFFWASLPKCQQSPCSKQGSWVLHEYQQSIKAPAPDIPLEQDCPYNPLPIDQNVLQTPLSSGCNRGQVKVQKYSEVYSQEEILKALQNNYPVVAGLKLSENFYFNTGYVFLQDVKNNQKLDDHASGHAVVLVGYMQLPPKLHATEGKFCFVTANSWGVGWGKGGHACLGQKWFEKYRYPTSFIALEAIQ